MFHKITVNIRVVNQNRIICLKKEDIKFSTILYLPRTSVTLCSEEQEFAGS